MKKLLVIDYIRQTVTVYPYDENIWNSPEEYTTEDGDYVVHDNCAWIVLPEVNIKIV